MWMQSSKWLAADGAFWGVLIIYNVRDGFSKVEQLVRASTSWSPCATKSLVCRSHSVVP